VHAPATASSTTETAVGVASGLAGLAILTMALFPLSLPLMFLLAASAIPLLLIGLVAGLAGALIAGAWLGMRALARLVNRPRRLTVRRRSFV
jgi:hypothetical protein